MLASFSTNAPAHRSQVALTAIRQAGFQIFDHPPYSPELSPNDFHLFPKLKYIRGTKFDNDNAVMRAVGELSKISNMRVGTRRYSS